jgi:hypothetical protein
MPKCFDNTRREARVLLDANVWRYIADSKSWPDLLRIARTKRVKILIAPSVVYEALRTRDVVVRQRLIQVMTLNRWQRLMPEAFSESQELLSEIRRLRPGWLKLIPDTSAFTRHRYDWRRSRGGFWDRVRHDPSAVAEQIARMDNGTLDRARVQAQERRQTFLTASWSDVVPLDTVRSRLLSPTSGWKGDDVEAWRLDGWSSVTSALQVAEHPYSDWLSTEVDLTYAVVDQSSWLQFWFYDIESKSMPRFWLRWAFEFIQGFRRVTDGTPCDSQLATYLPETDVVISADKAFIQIVDKCRLFAPCPLPAPVLIPGGPNGVVALMEELSTY